MYRGLYFIPNEKDIKENLGGFSEKILVKELKGLSPFLEELYVGIISFIDMHYEKIVEIIPYDYDEYIQNTRNDVIRLKDNADANEKMLAKYQFIIKQVTFIGQFLFRIKNALIDSLHKYAKVILEDVTFLLTKLNNMIDLLDHQTLEIKKNNMDISNDDLIYIKILNIFWVIDNHLYLVSETINEDMNDDFLEYFNEVKEQINNCQRECNCYNYDVKKSKRIYKEAKKLLNQVRHKYKLPCRENDFDLLKKVYSSDNKNNDTVRNFILNGLNELENTNKVLLEKEMDNYMLEDWQKELVRNGEYNPWNFEEDGDLEEEDYYFEDD